MSLIAAFRLLVNLSIDDALPAPRVVPSAVRRRSGGEGNGVAVGDGILFARLLVGLGLTRPKGGKRLFSTRTA